MAQMALEACLRGRVSSLSRRLPLKFGIQGVIYALNAFLNCHPTIVNYWLMMVTALLLMFGSANARGIVKPPVLSGRRLEGPTSNISDQTISGLGGSVRLESSCRAEYLAALTGTDQYDMSASSAAMTVMTLLPAMLTFAELPMASIRSLGFINTRMALFTSAMTLGLTISYKKTLKEENEPSVKDLLREEDIKRFGGDNKPQLNGTMVKDTSGDDDKPPSNGTVVGGTNGDDNINREMLDDASNINREPTLEDLREMYYDHDGVNQLLIKLTSPNSKPTSRPSKSTPPPPESTSSREKNWPLYCVYLVISIYNIFQLLLFGTLVRALPRIENIIFIWTCPDNSAKIFNAWLTITAVLSAIIRTLTNSSFVKHDDVLFISGLKLSPDQNCSGCSVLNQDIPTPQLWARVKERLRILFPDRFHWEGSVLILRRRIKRLRQQHPRIVVVRHSPGSRGRDIVRPALDGLIQTLSILALTFLFGSIWGGSLIWTLLFVTAFICVIWTSRICSLCVGGLLERKTGMTVIHYDTGTERRAILRVLQGMPNALVENKSNGEKFWAGHNLGKCNQTPDKVTQMPNNESKGPQTSSVTQKSDDVCGVTQQPSGRLWVENPMALIYGIVLGVLSVLVIFLAYFVATLPFNVPFVPSIWNWPDYEVASIVSLIIAVAYAFCMAFEFRSDIISDHTYFELSKSSKDKPNNTG